MKSHSILIGIVGISGSGKTTIANSVVKKLREEKHNVAYIRADHYYKALSHLTAEEFKKYDFDRPEALDLDGLYKDIQRLLNNEPIDRRIYPYASNSEDEATIKISPAPIIIVEGIFLLTDERLRKLFSLLFYVDTPLDCAIVRRINREIENNVSNHRSLHYYESQIRPAAFSNVINLKKHAHYILSNENKETRSASIEKATALIKDQLLTAPKKETVSQTVMRYSPLLLGLGVFALKLLTPNGSPSAAIPPPTPL